MRLFTSLLPISRISCNIAGQFDSNKLRTAAQLIIDLECLIKPLVVRETGLESYELVDGVFEYYAAVEAKKLNTRRGEFISAYIIPAGQDQNIAEQIALFRQANGSQGESPINTSLPDSSTGMLSQFAAMFQAFEQRIEQRFEALETKVGQNFENLEAKIGQRLDALEAANIKNELQQLKEHVSAIETKLNKLKPGEEPYGPLTDDRNEAEFIAFLNRASRQEIENIPFNPRIPSKTITALIEQRDIRQFTSRKDCLSNMKGNNFGNVRYEKLFDAWKEHRSVPISKLPEAKPQEPSASAETVINSSAPVTNNLATDTQPHEPIPPQNEPKKAQPPIAQSEPAKIVAPVPVIDSAIDKLNAMNLRDLAVKLDRLKFKKNITAAILKNRPFTSFEAMNIPGLGATTRAKLKNAFA